VYTGKAFAGLVEMVEKGELRKTRVLFIHTGGLPGLLAHGAQFTDELLEGSP
jgi:D-cysteine desulfhydrase